MGFPPIHKPLLYGTPSGNGVPNLNPYGGFPKLGLKLVLMYPGAPDPRAKTGQAAPSWSNFDYKEWTLHGYRFRLTNLWNTHGVKENGKIVYKVSVAHNSNPNDVIWNMIRTNLRYVLSRAKQWVGWEQQPAP